MDKALRNTFRSVVTQSRRLLEEALRELLEGQFGVQRSGKIEPDSVMVHLTADERQYREQILAHLSHIQVSGFAPADAVEQLVREAAFTHLNRLCAYKIAEKRGLIRESVSKGLKSQGFLFYLADHPEDERLWSGGREDLAYRHYLTWLGGTLSEDVGVLFSPQDLANGLFPPYRTLDQVLQLINDAALDHGWDDETLGWIYQYFTPKELRDQARKESPAPRNSYELAFRNQFYTPRYVVQFLVDNTLGRIWYEMREGQTALAERCRYLVRRPHEVFPGPGEVPRVEAHTALPAASGDRLATVKSIYVSHRPKKDPREIRILDPACGSGHFLLYCYDLLEIIYQEAYEDADLAFALKKEYRTIEDLRRALPALILRHNLHGVDIDLRATQIAAL